jgi:hypothetical protein
MNGLVWVTWRQQRALVVAAAAVIVAFGLSAALERGTGYTLGTSTTRTIAAFLPIGLGLLWGVPLLARPLEDHTADLVWSQSVPRVRWLACALTVVVATAALVSLATLAILPAVLAAPRFGLNYTYSVESAGAVGYTLFALALGIFAGAVAGRVEQAMAATLVAYTAVRLALDKVRLHLLPIEHATLTNKQAAHFHADVYLRSWISRQNDVLITYQSAPRMATIQWIELGIYTALTAALLAGTVVVIVRRGTHR